MEEYVKRSQYEVWKKKIEGRLSDIEKANKKAATDTTRKTQEYSAMKGKFAALQKEIRTATEGLTKLEKYCKQALGEHDKKFEAMEKRKARKGTSKQAVDVDSIQTPRDVVEIAQKALRAANRAEEILAKFNVSREKHGRIIPYAKPQKEESDE